MPNLFNTPFTWELRRKTGRGPTEEEEEKEDQWRN